ncbi:MAG: hypothetical protein N3F04_00700 [Candidatus Nezhaarchaeota archaeon]|nr:hypothetical protein [Candidatus Nezhaarchaeota archaeon]MCX8141295.1 hypothetical protein [Candidatus Nezhaarchaeota archaeon]MDW8049561.1 hypothetical protein [Nitrososphaerota archaeon]
MWGGCRCWCWCRPIHGYPPHPFFWHYLIPSLEDEVVALEDYKRHLEYIKTRIEREIVEIEARIKELRNMFKRSAEGSQRNTSIPPTKSN